MIIAGIKKVMDLYKNRGFDIVTVHRDNEFQKIESRIRTHINICAALQHMKRVK